MSTRKKYKIAVADDQCLFREGVISILKARDDLKVIIEAENGKDLIEAIEQEEPELVLLDLEMPVMDGVKAAEYLYKKHPHVKIIILTMYDDEEFILHLVNYGVRAFLLKECGTEILLEAIYCVLKDDHYFNKRFSKAMLKGLIETKKINPKFNTTDLSEREIEVLQLICKEFTNPEIGKKLGISIRTVEKHRDFILQKTGARNVAGIVMYAVKNRLLD